MCWFVWLVSVEIEPVRTVPQNRGHNSSGQYRTSLMIPSYGFQTAVPNIQNRQHHFTPGRVRQQVRTYTKELPLGKIGGQPIPRTNVPGTPSRNVYSGNVHPRKTRWNSKYSPCQSLTLWTPFRSQTEEVIRTGNNDCHADPDNLREIVCDSTAASMSATPSDTSANG